MDKALDRLLDGFAGFRDLYLGERRDLFNDLLEHGQHPKVLLIGCSDSRVDPAILTGAGPGDLFVVRNVAAIVPPYETDRRHHGTSSAIEFAVRGLAVEHIVVMGHQMCGGVRALGGDTGDQYDFLGDWVGIMADVRTRIDEVPLPPAARQRALELGCVLQSVRNLTGFPWIAERVRQGRLSLHGWYVDLHARQLLAYDPAAGRFLPAALGHRPSPADMPCGPHCACAALPSLLAAAPRTEAL